MKNNQDLIYGEIDFYSLAECFQFIKNQYGAFPDSKDGMNSGIFVDLGHGEGKAVLAACLLHPFKKCVGIEIIKKLYDRSCELKNKYMDMCGDINVILDPEGVNTIYNDHPSLHRLLTKKWRRQSKEDGDEVAELFS